MPTSPILLYSTCCLPYDSWQKGGRSWQRGDDFTVFCNSYKALLPGTVPAFPPVLIF